MVNDVPRAFHHQTARPAITYPWAVVASVVHVPNTEVGYQSVVGRIVEEEHVRLAPCSTLPLLVVDEIHPLAVPLACCCCTSLLVL